MKHKKEVKAYINLFGDLCIRVGNGHCVESVAIDISHIDTLIEQLNKIKESHKCLQLS